MAGPTRDNPFTAGLRAEQRHQVSERHRRAGMVGGARTAQLHRGKHTAWGAKAHAKGGEAAPASGPAVGKG